MSFESRLDRLLSGRPQELVDAITASRMLFRVAHLLQARIDDALAPLDIDMRGYLALVLIADDAAEPLRPSDLGVTLDATRTQVTRLLDALEARGLTRRLPSTQDRRSLQLALTPAGRALAKKAARLVHPAYAEAWRTVGAEGTARMLRGLRRLHDGLAPEDAA